MFIENTLGLYSNGEDDPLSATLFNLDGEQWKKLRTKVTQAFTSSKMKFMFPTVAEVGDRFRDHLFELVQQHDELEIKDLCACFTTDVIGSCGFGIECNSLKDPNTEFRYYGRKIFSAPRHSLSFNALIIGFKKIAHKLRLKVVRDDVSKFFLKLVRDTIDYREKNNVKRNDFVDILLKSNQDTTDKDKILSFHEIASLCFSFYVGGFGTSSATLTLCLYVLAQQPEIQSKARQAIREAYEKYNGQFTYEMMMDLPYIDKVIHGKFRLVDNFFWFSNETN